MPSAQSSLFSVPVAKRKQLAATLGLFATLFVAVGAVAATGPATMVVRVFVAITLIVAVVLALMAWGVVHSVREEQAMAADRDLDVLIDQALAAAPRRYGSMCNCGHEHDPTELHITDAVGVGGMSTDADTNAEADPEPVAVCAHDGAGEVCGHNCAECVLRPSPNRTRADRLSS